MRHARTRINRCTDVNGDNALDIVVGNWNRPNMLLLNEGPGIFMAPVELPGGASSTRALALSDIDRDGQLDLVVGNSDGVQLLLQAASGLTASTVVNIEAGGLPKVRALAIADMNGDGWPALVVAGRSDKANKLLLNTGTGSFSAGVDLPGGLVNTFSLAVGDMNGDGALDVVLANWNSPSKVLVNDGVGGMSDAGSIPGGTDVMSVALANLRPETGAVDIVVGTAAFVASRLVRNTNSGSGAFATKATELPGGIQASQAVAVGGDCHPPPVPPCQSPRRNPRLAALAHSSLAEYLPSLYCRRE